jgi:hypothetical protein
MRCVVQVGGVRCRVASQNAGMVAVNRTYTS